MMKRLIFLIFFLALVPAGAFAGFDDHFLQADDIGEAKVPNRGKSRVLVIPLIIDDIPTPETESWQVFFGNVLGENTFRNYWHVSSLGAFDVETVWTEPVHYATCPLAYKDCAVPRLDYNAFMPALDLLKEVFRRTRGNGVNFADYDVNGRHGRPDGWVDGVIVMTNADITGAGLPVSLFKRYKFDGVQVGAVALVSLHDLKRVALHEFGHLLGFADLYHEDKKGRGVYLTLMGQSREHIYLLDVYSRVKIGWADVEAITGAPQLVALPPAITTGRVLRIGGDKEYYLIENRGPDRFYDGGLSAPGLAVYHIDETQLPAAGRWAVAQLYHSTFVRNEWRPPIMNEQPDGAFRIQRGLTRDPNACVFRRGDALRPDYVNQTPFGENNAAYNSNWYNGSPSGIVIEVVDAQTSAPDIILRVGYE